MTGSVRLSVCLSVRHTFFTMFPSSYHHEIFRSYYHGQKWCPCTRSEVKCQGHRGVNTQLSRLRTRTKVWIHTWQWNHAHSWKQHRKGALLFFEVICQISRSHGSKNCGIWPRLGVSGLYLQFDFTNGYEMIHKAWSSIEEVPYFFSRSSIKLQGHTALKIYWWHWNDAQSLMYHRRGALLFFKVIRQVWRSHG